MDIGENSVSTGEQTKGQTIIFITDFATRYIKTVSRALSELRRYGRFKRIFGTHGRATFGKAVARFWLRTNDNYSNYFRAGRTSGGDNSSARAFPWDRRSRFDLRDLINKSGFSFLISCSFVVFSFYVHPSRTN